MNGGLHRFRDRVDPGLLSEIDAWIGRHPLVRIRSALEARTDEKAFFDALAEAVLARHVLSLGFDVETEVPTVGNMTADLRVSKGGREVFLHVKRVATDIDNRASRQIVISPAAGFGNGASSVADSSALELGGHRSSNAAFGGGGDGLPSSCQCG